MAASRRPGCGLHPAPAPWASPLAYALYALAALGLVILFVRLRLAVLRRRTEELEALVAARTLEVEDQKAHIEEQNRRIAGLVERAGLAQQDLMAWAKEIGKEVAQALSAEEVGLFMVQEEGFGPWVRVASMRRPWRCSKPSPPTVRSAGSRPSPWRMSDAMARWCRSGEVVGNYSAESS